MSGGIGSLCLANMMNESINGKTVSKRKMFFTAQLLHVDERVLIEAATGKKVEYDLENIEKFSEDTSLALHIIDPLEYLGDLDRKCVLEMLEDAPDTSSTREDLIKILRNRAIFEYCKKNDIDLLVSGATGLRVIII